MQLQQLQPTVAFSSQATATNHHPTTQLLQCRGPSKAPSSPNFLHTRHLPNGQPCALCHVLFLAGNTMVNQDLSFHNPWLLCCLSSHPLKYLQALLAGAKSSPSINWYSDSDASHRITSHAQNIQQKSPFEGPDQIIIGNGQSLSVTSMGSSSFKSPLNPSFTLTLQNLLHVPTITKNLLSVSKSVFSEFYPDICLVKSQGSNEILLKGLLGQDCLYKFPNLLLKSATFAPNSFSACFLPKHVVSSLPTANTATCTSSFLSYFLGIPDLDIQVLCAKSL